MRGPDLHRRRVHGGGLSRSWRRAEFVGGAAVAVAALAACGGGGGGGEAHEYGPEARDEFVDACSAGGGASQDACRCFYDRLGAEVPFERFEQVDAQIRDDPADIPGDIVDLAVECSVVRPAPDG